MFDKDEFVVERSLSRDDVRDIKEGVELGTSVVSAVGAVVVAIAGIIALFSKDD